MISGDQVVYLRIFQTVFQMIKAEILANGFLPLSPKAKSQSKFHIPAKKVILIFERKYGISDANYRIEYH